jgi:hypothetical protein
MISTARVELTVSNSAGRLRLLAARGHLFRERACTTSALVAINKKAEGLP